MAARCDKCPQLVHDLFCGSAAVGTTVLQHVDCTSETLDEILQCSVSQPNRKSVCKYQTFSLPEPFEMTASALRLDRKYVSYELEGQNERLDRIFAGNGPEDVLPQTSDLNRAPPRIATLGSRGSNGLPESQVHDLGALSRSFEPQLSFRYDVTKLTRSPHLLLGLYPSNV